MSPEAQYALHAMGVEAHLHSSRNLTAELATDADVIFCMTRDQRRQAIAQFPKAAARIHCLADGDIEDPPSEGKETYQRVTRQRTLHAKHACGGLKKVSAAPLHRPYVAAFSGAGAGAENAPALRRCICACGGLRPPS
jgi:hypothetical protein